MEITCQHICAALQLICARPRWDRGALLGNLNRHVTWSSLSVAFWLSSCPLISHSYVTFLNYLTSNHHNSNWTLCSEVKSYNIGKKHPLTFELITWFVVPLHSLNVCDFTAMYRALILVLLNTVRAVSWWIVCSLGLNMPALHEMDREKKKKDKHLEVFSAMGLIRCGLSGSLLPT